MLKRILKWLGIAIALFVLLVIVIFGTTRCSAGKYDPPVSKLAAELVPLLSTGDAEHIRRFFVPEALPEDVKEVDKYLKAYQKLGKYKSHGTPVFKTIRKITGAPYSTQIDYEIPAEFEAGPALISATFVPRDDGSLGIWWLHVTSDAFLK